MMRIFLHVPWNKLIYFGKSKDEVLDCDRMSKELTSTLGLGNEGLFTCELINSKEDKEIAKNYNLKKFTNEFSYYVATKVSYKIGSLESDLSFVYDLKTGKVSNIEFFN